ncbi:hypothetical protein [Anaerococcus obesiensis]|uniref:hypothetical protein n=1 Tax=Anaerococcus obesiensis TaxID=1287640 RepID=UPI003994313B
MTDNLRENLELVEVVYENNDKKAVLKFLDIENGEILEVNFNKQVFNNGKWKDDKEKAEKVDEWCEEYFEKDFSKLSDRVGDKFNVYRYEKFNSMWESEEIIKFTKDQKGMIFTTKIESVEDTGTKISIKYLIDKKLYETKMTYADYMEDLKQWFTNPQKKVKQFKKFEDKFGVSVDKSDEILGKEIMVEVKVAFGKYPFGDIKKPNWANKDK